MRTPFKPVGARPRWQDILDVLIPLKVDEVVTYEALGQAVGFDIRPNRGDFYKAVEVLQREHSRTMEVVRNQGYRVVAANEHGRLAKMHHRKARRQITKATEKIASADRTKLSAEERARFDRMESTLRAHGNMIKDLEQRAARNEARLKFVEVSQEEATAEQIARIDRLEEILKRHGIGN